MTNFRATIALSALVLASCSSPLPTTTDMERYYQVAEKQAERDIARLAERRNMGEISSDEYELREAAIKKSIPQRANQIAWARHELAESEMRAMGIPTASAPVQVTAPGRSSTGDSLYRPAGQIGSGYQGSGMRPGSLRN